LNLYLFYAKIIKISFWGSDDMACNVIFVRHGQSEGNLLRVFLGHTDRNLTQLGEMQAKKTAEFLKDRKIDRIYSSDLKRAFNTAKPLADLKGIDIIKTEELREIFAGYWENISINDIKEKYVQSYNTWMSNIGRARLDGGESVIELQERIKNEVMRIVSENDNKTIADSFNKISEIDNYNTAFMDLKAGACDCINC
jgi:probable phosphoglycerate mutase